MQYLKFSYVGRLEVGYSFETRHPLCGRNVFPSAEMTRRSRDCTALHSWHASHLRKMMHISDEVREVRASGGRGGDSISAIIDTRMTIVIGSSSLENLILFALGEVSCCIDYFLRFLKLSSLLQGGRQAALTRSVRRHLRLLLRQLPMLSSSTVGPSTASYIR